MTFSEKGLARAMKAAYKNYGYTVAQSDSGLLIITDNWGVGIKEALIPNEIKGLIVCHSPVRVRQSLFRKTVQTTRYMRWP